MPAGKITALRAQAHDQQRVNVFINDAFALGVSLNTVSRERLYVGKELSEADFQRLEHAEDDDHTYQVALRFLDARPRSANEIRERLRQKGCGADQIENAIERLRQVGLVDDAQFARFWIENRQICRPRGPGALRQELRSKGVDRDTIDEALRDNQDTHDLTEQAWTLARAAVRRYTQAPDRATFSRRLGGYLQRRGFDGELIRPIVDQLWKERSTFDDEE